MMVIMDSEIKLPAYSQLMDYGGMSRVVGIEVREANILYDCKQKRISVTKNKGISDQECELIQFNSENQMIISRKKVDF